MMVTELMHSLLLATSTQGPLLKPAVLSMQTPVMRYHCTYQTIYLLLLLLLASSSSPVVVEMALTRQLGAADRIKRKRKKVHNHEQGIDSALNNIAPV